jgi:ABC-type phosphate/phosphonate transport system permease subunit
MRSWESVPAPEAAFQYDKVATLTVVVLVMVIAIEQLSVWIRRRLR